MIHGPCGPLNPNCVCMVDGKCTKKYSKCFNPCTSIDNYGYPTYRRRDDGKTIKIRDNDLDNRWVIPNNPYLSRKYIAQILRSVAKCK